MNNRGLIILGIIIVVVEAIGFRLWILSEQPDPSVSIGEILIIPILFGVNVIIGTALYFLNQRKVFRLFFINALVAPIIFHFNWTTWYSGWTERNYTVYSFSIQQRKFELSLSKTADYFSISDVTDKPNGSTTGLFMGDYRIAGDSIILTDEQTKMLLLNDRLIGLPDQPNEIALTKITK